MTNYFDLFIHVSGRGDWAGDYKSGTRGGQPTCNTSGSTNQLLITHFATGCAMSDQAMTTNQTIDGVPREMISVPLDTLKCYLSGDGGDWVEAGHELRALLDAADHVHEWDINSEGTATVCHCGARSSDEPAEQPAPVAVAIPDECPHLIVFDDADRENMLFAGSGARSAALKTWEKISMSWNAHLFVRVDRNCRDDRYPSASTN